MDLGNTHARIKEWSITSHYFRFELIIESKNIYRNATLVWAYMYVTRCWWYLSIRNVYTLSTEDSTYGSLMQTGVYYTNIDCSRGEWWKIVVPEMKFNLGRLFTEAGSSRPRLNFTEGTIIFYHSVNKKKTVNVCFILPIYRFLVRTEPYNLESRLSSSKFGSCGSFFKSQGNSKKEHTWISFQTWTLSKIIHVMWPSFNQSDDLNLCIRCIIVFNVYMLSR